MGQVVLGQSIQVMEDAVRGQTPAHLRPQHPPQQGHQQARRHPLAHHVPHHQAPTFPFPLAPCGLGSGRDEVVVIATHLESGSTTGREINTLDDRAAVWQQLGLDLRADDQLTIEAFVAAPVLLKNLVLQGHPGEIGHELEVAAIHLTPAIAPPTTEHVQPSPLTIARHDGGGHHLGRTQQATDKGIEHRHNIFPTSRVPERTIGES